MSPTYSTGSGLINICVAEKIPNASSKSSGLPISLIQFMGLFYRREHINLHSFILDVDLIKCSIRTTDMHAIYRGIDGEIKFLFISEISRKRIDTKFFSGFP